MNTARLRARPAPAEPHHLFRPHGWLDWVFVVGIVGKGLNGLAELLGGAALLFVTHVELSRLLQWLTRSELAEDPHDLIARYLLHSADGISDGTVIFAALYLLSHGIVKVVLVTAVLRDRLWAYPWMIGFLLAFIGYQLYRIAVQPTPGMIALTVFDALIVALTVREYRQRRGQPAART